MRRRPSWAADWQVEGGPLASLQILRSHDNERSMSFQSRIEAVRLCARESAEAPSESLGKHPCLQVRPIPARLLACIWVLLPASLPAGRPPAGLCSLLDPVR